MAKSSWSRCENVSRLERVIRRNNTLSRYSLTKSAQRDFASVLDYTQDRWGERQAEKYRQGLETCFVLLAGDPHAGRFCDDIRLGLRRFEFEKHVVFYRQLAEGIRISRILHQSRLPDLVRFPK